MKAAFFETNRQRLMSTLQGGIVVLTAYSAMQRGNDASFPFEQEASFWWLTGIEEPDWKVIIDAHRQKCWLVRPIVSETHQIFDGSLSPEAATAISGISSVVSYDESLSLLRDAAKHHSVVRAIGESSMSEYYDFIQNPAQKKLWGALERIFNRVEDCQKEIARLRAIKQPEEVKAIQRAIDLTIEGFEKVKESLDTFSYEYEIEAEFDYLFRRKGSQGHAYDAIVAGGKNACTLHYDKNTDKLKRPSLLLMDIGARRDGYAADITRTYGIGKITNRQRAVHQAVETAHQQIIKLIKPGITFQAYFELVDQIMKYSLEQLGLLKKPEDYRKYFPHAVSHGLGVDVHDSLGRPFEFQTGMVLTVEPGIYIPEEGIGVRIEDDILVTENGHRNLSKKLSTGL